MVQKISRLLYKIQAQMAESEAIKAAITQTAIQAATTSVMVLREADMRPASSTNTANLGEAKRPRHGRPALRHHHLTEKLKISM